MRLIAIEEKDISSFLDKLELTELQIKNRYKAEHADLAATIHRAFHYEVVKFFQGQGADCKRN